MLSTKRLAVIAAFALATLVGAACSNSVTDVAAAHREVRPTASHDSTGGGTCLTGWVVVDGIATCPGGH
jgi:hypothetical protein